MSDSTPKTAEELTPKTGGKAFQKVANKKDESVYNLAVGDPDADVSDLGEIRTKLPDDLPEGTNPKKYRYIWVPANPRFISAGIRALIDEGVGKPVSPDGPHSKIEKRLFTGNEIVVMDAVLWYFNKKRADYHLSQDLREAREKVSRLPRVGENQIAIVAGNKYEGEVR